MINLHQTKTVFEDVHEFICVCEWETPGGVWEWQLGSVCEGVCVWEGLTEGYYVTVGHLFPSFQELCLLLPYSTIVSFTLISFSAKIATKASHAGGMATL